MKVIITAAGKGSRFIEYGINKPKYLLRVNKKTLLEYSLLTIQDFFSEEFIFIFRNISSKEKIEEIIENCSNYNNEKINNYKIININDLTSGQAETVLKAENFLNSNESILVFNIDTFVFDSHNFIKRSNIDDSIDGLIYTTNAEGNHWSFAKTLPNSEKVVEVSEKIKISDNASIGLYYFKSFKEFKNIAISKSLEIKDKYKELYIMPIYKYLIENNKNIVIKKIPFKNFFPLGTPNEAIAFDENFIKENK